VRFDRIRLENFKCYQEVDIELNAGVTVIHGLNGSGKSSLLEACFFALYGSKALEKTLNEIVTIGETETIVELWFSHAGESYHITRRIRVSNGDARTANCVLEGPERTLDGATDVRAHVAELLRMDTEAFVNCAYVRQGEVNKLINASPSDRQDMLDDLLQLGKLEQYRERASKARVGVGRVRGDKQGALGEVTEQIAEKENEDLHEQLNQLQSKLSERAAEIERFESNRKEARNSLETAESVLETYEEKREELETLEADITELRERIQETERKREAFSEHLSEKRDALEAAKGRREDFCDALEIETGDVTTEQVATLQTEHREEINSITERITELSVEKQEYNSDAETLTEQAESLEESTTEKREKATELEAELEEDREDIEAKQETLGEISTEIEAKKDQFEGEPVGFGDAQGHRETIVEKVTTLRERRAKLQTELENEQEQLEEAKALRDAGKCPECGQSVEGSPHIDAIGDQQERIEELEAELAELAERESELTETAERAAELVEIETGVGELENRAENLQAVLEEREQNIEEKAERIDQLREEATENESEAETKREQAATKREQATECQESIAECNRKKAELSTQVEQLESLETALDDIADIEDDIETLQTQREEKAEINDERRERLAEKRDRRSELQESFDEKRVEKAREEKDKAEAYLEKVTEKLETLESKRNKLQGKIGAVENEIEALEELRERRDRLADRVDQLDSLYSEVEALEEMYGRLRAQLRQRNVESLERMLNETFDLVYENDTYSRIELDGEYQLTVYQKDGETLDPEQLSGGERALFNLSLRCAIYQLLAEGIEGTAPMPPLILDEPTVFLDSGHVSQLVELVDSMRQLGVEQILVVSHDEELVAAADDLVTVRKDSTTNRSTVERAGKFDEQLLADADD